MRFPALTPMRLTGLVAAAVCAAALIPVAALAATGSPAASAQAARASASAASAPTIRVDSVTLVAKGAAISVVFTATCNAGDDRNIGSTTTQAVGNRLAQGTTGTYASGACTGKPQQVTEIAAVNVSGAPFRPGIAMIQASVGDCPATTPNCSGASTERVLSIRAN
jgi:hypothetical protein